MLFLNQSKATLELNMRLNFVNINKLKRLVMSKNNEKTSKKVAKIASELLRDKKSTKKVKTVAASALTQAANKKKGKK